jgi:hypothetical protein
MRKNISRSEIKGVEGAYNGVGNANFRIDIQFELGSISKELRDRLLQPKTCHYIIWKNRVLLET